MSEKFKRRQISLDEKIEILERFSKQEEKLTGQTIFEGYPIGQWAIQIRHEINKGREVSPEQYEKLSELRILERQIDSTIDEKIDALVKWNEKYPKARIAGCDSKILREYALLLGEEYDQLLSKYEKMQQYYEYIRYRKYGKKLTPEQLKKCNEGNVGGTFGVPASWIQKYGIDEEKIEYIINNYGTVDNFMDKYLHGDISSNDINFLGDTLKCAINIDSNIRNNGYDELAKDLARYLNESVKMIIYSREAIENLLQNFPDNKIQRTIIEEMYGLQTGEKKNIQEIANKIGINKQKTRECADKAIANLAGIIEGTRMEEVFPIGLDNFYEKAILADFKQTIKESGVIFNSEKQTAYVEPIKKKAEKIKKIKKAEKDMLNALDEMMAYCYETRILHIGEEEERFWRKIKEYIKENNGADIKVSKIVWGSDSDKMLSEMLCDTFPEISLEENKNMMVEDMNLTFRTLKSLKRAGVNTLEDLLQIEHLDEIKNLNKNEIREKIKLYVSNPLEIKEIDLKNEEYIRKIIAKVEDKINDCRKKRIKKEEILEKYRPEKMSDLLFKVYIDEDYELLKKIYAEVMEKDESDIQDEQEKQEIIKILKGTAFSGILPKRVMLKYGDIPLKNMNFSTRTYTALKRLEINNLSELLEYQTHLEAMMYVWEEEADEIIEKVKQFVVEVSVPEEESNTEEQEIFEGTAFSGILPKRVILKQGDVTLRNMNFSTKAYQVLNGLRIGCLSNLLEYPRTLGELHGIGKKTSDEIIEKVKQYVEEASVPEEERDNIERQEIFEIFEDTVFSNILPKRVILEQGDLPIENMGFTFGVRRQLENEFKIYNLSDLLMMETDEWNSLRGIGKKGRDIIKEQVRKYVVDAVEQEDNLEVNAHGEEAISSEIDENEDKHDQEKVIEEKQEDTTTSKQFEINRFLENSRKLAELDSKLAEAIKGKNEVEAQRIKEERGKTAKEIQDYLNK